MKKPNNMRWSDVMNLLDQEIEWCIETVSYTHLTLPTILLV